MTFDEIVDAVEAILQDLPDETRAMIPYWVKEGQRRIEDSHGFLSMESGAIFTAAADTAVLGARPADYRSALDDPYLIDGFGRDTRLRWIQQSKDIIDQFSGIDDPLMTGRPKAIEETADAFIVWPRPDALSPVGSVYTDGLWRIGIPYWKRHATLGGEIQNNWWTDNADRYLMNHAASQGFLMNRDYPEHARWEGETLLEKRRLVNFDKRARLPRQLSYKPARAIFGSSAARRGWRW
jgi:hypothetical protein